MLPPPARQAAPVARIGVLGTWPDLGSSYLEAFRAGLRDLGYVEGTNLALEYRLARGDVGRLPELAAELVELKVDVIATHAQGVPAARGATTTTPIVMLVFADAVAAGLIENLAHPGGNVTGSTMFNAELMSKRLELLKATMPSMRDAAVLLNPSYPLNGAFLDAMTTTATALGVAAHPFEARAAGDFEGAFMAMTEQGMQGLVLHDDPLFITNASPIAALAAKHRLPSIGALESARAGGLMAYGVEFPDLYRRAAYFVDKILKGSKPGDLPVERATTFKLVLNLPVARSLGVSVPPSVLQQATEVVE
jgi:putative ABC transport system substrate-binding protein